MERQRGPVQYCFMFAVVRDPELAAQDTSVGLRLVINPEGHVAQCGAIDSLDEPLAFCVCEAVSAFQFPVPRKGQLVTTQYRYLFPPSLSPEERTIKAGAKKNSTEGDPAPRQAPIRRRR